MRTLRLPSLILALVFAALLATGCRNPSPVTLPPAVAREGLPSFTDVDRLLEGFREHGAFPGGVLAVGHRGALVHLHPFGRLTWEADAPRVTADTLYDLASLTKVVATTTMAMILVDEGRLDLDRPVREFLPGFQGSGKEAVTVRHLLTHSSGLPAVAPLFKEIQGRKAYVERIQAMDLEYPPGSRSVYSDLGIILLGEILERVAGQPFEAFVRARIFEPLGMRDTLFRPPAELRSRIAPTEFDPWRGRLTQGEVHDENAFAMGGVAPHAGLFATAGDLARFAQMLLNGGIMDGRRIVSRETVKLFTRRAGIPGSDRALGWDTKSAEGSSAGTLFSPRSFGHTGFTGTSIWMDPERGLYVILLTNRVHPTRENNLIREARPAVADAVVRALSPASPPVRVGLERIAAGEAGALEGKRLGLIVHGASVTAEGRHAVEVLRERGLNVVRLFSPEHGLRGQAAAGESVESDRDPVSGLPVVSLYGERRQPTPADLAGLDVLVFDLQDAGVLLHLREHSDPRSAGGGGCRDRLRGARPAQSAGGRADRRPGERASGGRPGELPQPRSRAARARLDARRDGPLCQRTARTAGAPDCRSDGGLETEHDLGRHRPNVGAAVTQSAQCRGRPGLSRNGAVGGHKRLGRPGNGGAFLLLGAPWLDASGVSVSVPGFDLEPVPFIPRESKHEGEECRGLRVHVTDSANAEPYRLGLSLLAILSRQPGFAWRDDGDALTRLLGTPRLIEDLRAGKMVEEILAADAADHAAWRRERRPALLYP